MAAWQFTGIHIGIPRNLPDLCKLLVTCTICCLYHFLLWMGLHTVRQWSIVLALVTLDGRSHSPLLQLCCLLTHLVFQLTVDCLIHMLAGGTYRLSHTSNTHAHAHKCTHTHSTHSCYKCAHHNKNSHCHSQSQDRQ